MGWKLPTHIANTPEPELEPRRKESGKSTYLPFRHSDLQLASGTFIVDMKAKQGRNHMHRKAPYQLTPPRTYASTMLARSLTLSWPYDAFQPGAIDI